MWQKLSMMEGMECKSQGLEQINHRFPRSYTATIVLILATVPVLPPLCHSSFFPTQLTLLPEDEKEQFYPNHIVTSQYTVILMNSGIFQQHELCKYRIHTKVWRLPVCEMLDMNSIFTWLITQEGFVSRSHCDTSKFYKSE